MKTLTQRLFKALTATQTRVSVVQLSSGLAVAEVIRVESPQQGFSTEASSSMMAITYLSTHRSENEGDLKNIPINRVIYIAWLYSY